MDLIIAFRDTEMAEAAYRLLHPHIADTGATGTGLVLLSGSLHWPLGRLAALLGRTEQALDHFAQAVTVNARLGARPFIALTRLHWADALNTSGSDLARARILARQAALRHAAWTCPALPAGPSAWPASSRSSPGQPTR